MSRRLGGCGILQFYIFFSLWQLNLVKFLQNYSISLV